MLDLLSGTRVLEVASDSLVALAGAHLVELGADVIQVETFSESVAIRPAASPNGGSQTHLSLNHDKRSIELDLTKRDGRSKFERLVRSSDVVIAGSTSESLRLIGADHDSLHAIKEDLVYCSLTGYGDTGPYSQLPVLVLPDGMHLAAAAGLVKVEIGFAGRPSAKRMARFAPSSLYPVAVDAVLSILAALVRRDATAGGAHLDVSSWDTNVTAWQREFAMLEVFGDLGGNRPPERYGPRYAVYRCADGAFVFVALIRPKYWIQFCELVDRQDLCAEEDDDLSLAYGQERTDLANEIAAIVESRPQSAWLALANQEGLPISPVNNVRQLLTNEHVAARSVFASVVDNESGRQAVVVRTLPIKLADQVPSPFMGPPTLGRDTDQILNELGLDNDN